MFFYKGDNLICNMQQLRVEALEKDNKAEKEEVEEGTLDKAFPFLFG